MFPDKPKPKRKAIPKAKRDRVWNKYIGVSVPVGKCYACKKPIHYQEFEVGHNRAVAKGGSDEISNLRPICHKCNKDMRTMSIETFKVKVLGKPKGGTKSVVGLDKIETYLTKQGYDISSKKHGFDVVGVKKRLTERNLHVVVGFNNERTVTSEYVLKFKKKVGAYNEKMSDILMSPHVEGLIAYTGALSKDAPVVVKASKPAIKFKKF